jgi:hypothetical protein
MDEDDDLIDIEDYDDRLPSPALFHDPCPTCLPGNPHGYVCPVPVPTAPGQQIPIHQPVLGHVACGFCGELMPHRNVADEQCAACGLFACHSIADGEDCIDSILLPFKGLPLPVTSINAALKIDGIDFDFDSFMADTILITANSFHQNNVEYQKFIDYKRNQNMTTNQLRDHLVLYFQQNPSTSTTPSQTLTSR